MSQHNMKHLPWEQRSWKAEVASEQAGNHAVACV